MSVKAKFLISSVEEFHGGQKSIKAFPVNSKDGDNGDYSAATPGGSLQLSISPGLPASDFFKPGKKYYAVFTEETE